MCTDRDGSDHEYVVVLRGEAQKQADRARSTGVRVSQAQATGKTMQGKKRLSQKTVAEIEEASYVEPSTKTRANKKKKRS